MNNKYLLHGKLTPKPGYADELADILLRASKLLSTATGCRLYVIGKDGNEGDSVWVTDLYSRASPCRMHISNEKMGA